MVADQLPVNGPGQDFLQVGISLRFAFVRPVKSLAMKAIEANGVKLRAKEVSKTDFLKAFVKA